MWDLEHDGGVLSTGQVHRHGIMVCSDEGVLLSMIDDGTQKAEGLEQAATIR
jgi:hypothetical protein